MARIFHALLLICGLTLGCLAAQSAPVIKVAILETVDKTNEVKYGERLLVRSSLAHAVASTPGFEAYDRVDLESIFGEQDFQRTGLVSADQIKQLGVMTGAKYILLPEIAKLNDKSFYITAKILDVETTQAISVSGATTTNEVSSMEEACKRVANELLGLPSEKESKTKQQIIAGHINELGWTYDGQHYYQNGYQLKRSEVNKTALAQMKLNDQVAYNYYKKNSRPLIIAGWTLFGFGTASALFAFPAMLGAAAGIRDRDYDSWFNMQVGAFSFCGVGTIATIASLPCIIIGHKRKNQYVNNYLLGKTIQPKYAHYMPNAANQPYLSLNLQSSANGLGVALSF